MLLLTTTYEKNYLSYHIFSCQKMMDKFTAELILTSFHATYEKNYLSYHLFICQKLWINLPQNNTICGKKGVI